jgi:hypothetical protein
MLIPLDIQLSYALLDPRILLRFCWPPALLSRSPRFQASPVLLPLTLSLTWPSAIWSSCSTLDPQPVVTLLNPHSDIARTGPSVHHRTAGPSATRHSAGPPVLLSQSHFISVLRSYWTHGHADTPAGPPAVLRSYWTPVGSHTLYFPLRCCITLWGCQASSVAHSASGLAGRALESRNRSLGHHCFIWPAPATGYRHSLWGPQVFSLTPVGVPSHREVSF